MRQPIISHLRTWERHRQEILTVIREALRLLAQQPNLPQGEDSPKKHSLNRHLARDCFRKAAYRNNLQNLMPTYNGTNPPYKDDEEPQPRESTKPDFYWQFIDRLADEDSCERRFVLECKRLGNPSSRSWNLNENYVQHGIRRFITTPHEYGKGDNASGMIGYVQSMQFDDILDEVNTAATNSHEPISDLCRPLDGWQEDGVSELAHELTRNFPIAPFRLCHFWVDLRRNN